MIDERAHPFLDKEHRKIQRLFDGIAPRYDFLNHLLSFQLDRAWRRRAIAELGAVRGGCYLDACSGTGDLAFALLRHLGGDATRVRSNGAQNAAETRIYASDFSQRMLELGAAKIARGVQCAPRFLAGDTLSLPFANGKFDGAIVGFGIRNVEDLHAGLVELHRVLRTGGCLVLLEFTPMQNRMLRPFSDFYTRRVLPFIGNLISGSKEGAYRYLNDSIERWPSGAKLVECMSAAGFRDVRWRPLCPGNVAIHRGYR